MKKQGFKATTLRSTLSTLLIILIGLAGAGFYWAQDWLGDLSGEVNDLVATATGANEVSSKEFEELQRAVSQRQAAGIKASELIMSNQNYQSRVIEDINSYAGSSGITVTNYSFGPTTNTSGSSPLPSGVKAENVTVTLENPVSFDSLINFIKGIETNIPKLQLTGINLSLVNNNSIKVDPLIIEVYVR